MLSIGFAGVAQLVEQRLCNPQVTSSSLVTSSNKGGSFMSLQVYIDGADSITGLSVCYDVEYLFRSVKLTGCDYDKVIIKSIEKGSYLDCMYYTDRFDSKLSLAHMSTGSKAALSVYHNSNVVVWCGEVGCNALTEIIKNCNVGSVLLPWESSCIFGCLDDYKIDVNRRGRRPSKECD